MQFTNKIRHLRKICIKRIVVIFRELDSVFSIQLICKCRIYDDFIAGRINIIGIDRWFVFNFNRNQEYRGTVSIIWCLALFPVNKTKRQVSYIYTGLFDQISCFFLNVFQRYHGNAVCIVQQNLISAANKRLVLASICGFLINSLLFLLFVLFGFGIRGIRFICFKFRIIHPQMGTLFRNFKQSWRIRNQNLRSRGFHILEIDQ